MWVELLTGAKRVVDMLPIDAAPLLRQGLARRVDGPSVSHGEAGGAISSVVAPPATVQPADDAGAAAPGPPAARPRRRKKGN